MADSNKDNEPAYYLLVCMDAVDACEQRVAASEIAVMRLRSMTWPLYERTGHVGRLKRNDHCLVYIGGTGPSRQSFIGGGTVGAICSTPSSWAEGDGSLITDPAFKLLRFSDVEKWQNPVSIRPHI